MLKLVLQFLFLNMFGCDQNLKINKHHDPEINMYSYILTNFAFVFLRGRSQMSREGSGELILEMKGEICL